MKPADTIIQTKDRRSTSLGVATYIRIFTPDYRKLSWREIWDTFSDSYPEQWAVQWFPPAGKLVDDQNIYHLFVLESEPQGFKIQAENGK